MNMEILGEDQGRVLILKTKYRGAQDSSKSKVENEQQISQPKYFNAKQKYRSSSQQQCHYSNIKDNQKKKNDNQITNYQSVGLLNSSVHNNQIIQTQNFNRGFQSNPISLTPTPRQEENCYQSIISEENANLVSEFKISSIQNQSSIQLRKHNSEPYVNMISQDKTNQNLQTKTIQSRNDIGFKHIFNFTPYQQQNNNEEKFCNQQNSINLQNGKNSSLTTRKQNQFQNQNFGSFTTRKSQNQSVEKYSNFENNQLTQKKCNQKIFNDSFAKNKMKEFSVEKAQKQNTTDDHFKFDLIYGENNTNRDIYEQTVKKVVLTSLQGINATVFVYGQTGTGKTYTIMGNQRTQLIDCKQVQSSRQSFETFNYKTNSKVSDKNENFNNKRSLYDAYENSGVLVFAMQDLFEKIEQIQNHDGQKKFEIKLSYIEIYNEVVYDLMQNQQKQIGAQVDDCGLNIHEGKDKQFYIKGVKEIVVNNIDEVLEYIQIGEKNRHYAQTILNHSSSRSHTLFRLQLFQSIKCEFTNTNIQTSNFLNFVDLAGSEKIQNIARQSISASQTSYYDQNQRLKEGLSINKSLFNLTQVIHLLSQKQQKHIPYRNSTLTKILKSSLSSNSKTTIIVCITPSSSQIDQTLNSLKFGQKAMKIQQSAQVQINEIKSNALQNRSNFSNIKNFDNQKKNQDIINDYENKINLLEQQIQSNKETLQLKKKINEQQEEGKRLEEAIEILGDRSFHTKLIYLQKSKGEQIINFKFAGDVILQTTKQSLYNVHKIIEDKYQKNNELVLMANNCRAMFNSTQSELKQCRQENMELKEECDRLESEYQDIINEFAKMKNIQKEIFEITKSKEKMIKFEEQEYDFHSFSDIDIKKIEIHFYKLLADLKLEKDNRRNLKISTSFKSVQSYNEIKSQIQNKSLVLQKRKSPQNQILTKDDLNIDNRKSIELNNFNQQNQDELDEKKDNKNKKMVTKLNLQMIEKQREEQKYIIKSVQPKQNEIPEYAKEEIALKNEILIQEQQKKINQKLAVQCNRNVQDQSIQDPYQNWNQKIGNRNIEPIQEEVLKENDPSSLENASDSIGFDVSPQLYPGYFQFQSKDEKQNKAQQKYFINCINLQKKIQQKQNVQNQVENDFDQKQLFKNVYQAQNFYNLQKQLTPNNNYQLRNKQSQFNPIINQEDIINDHGKSQSENQIENLSFVNQKNNFSCENSMGNIKDLLNDQILNEELASEELINDLQINMQKNQYDIFTVDQKNVFQLNPHFSHNLNTNYDIQQNQGAKKIQKNCENNQNIFQYNNVKMSKQENGCKSDQSTQPVLSIFNRKDSFCHDSCSRQNPLLTGAQNSPRKSTLSALTQNIKSSENTNLQKHYNLNSPAKILNEQITNLQKSPQFQILTKPLISLKYLHENQSNLQIKNQLKENYENENIYDQKKSNRQISKKGPKNVSIDLTIEEESPQKNQEFNSKTKKDCNITIQQKMIQKKQIIVSEKQLDFKYFEEIQTPDMLVQINDDELSDLTGLRSQTAQGIEVSINEEQDNLQIIFRNSKQVQEQSNFNSKTHSYRKKENHQIEQSLVRPSIFENHKDKSWNERKQDMNLGVLQVNRQMKELSNDLSSSRITSQSNSHTPFQSANQSKSFNPTLNKEIRRLQKTNKKLMDNNEKYMRIYKDLQNKKYEQSNQQNNIKIYQHDKPYSKKIEQNKQLKSSRNMESQGNMSERVNNESKESISKQQIDVIDLKQSEYYTNINKQPKTFRQSQPSAQQLLEYQDQPVQVNHQSSLSCIQISNSKSNNSAVFQDSHHPILSQSLKNQQKDQSRINIYSKNSRQSVNSQKQTDLKQQQMKSKYETSQIGQRQQKLKQFDNYKQKQSGPKMNFQLRKSVSPIISQRNEDQKGNKIGNISNILIQKILDERMKHISSLIENGVLSKSPTHILEIQKIQKDYQNNHQVQFFSELNQNQKQKQKVVLNQESLESKKVFNKNQLICQSSLKLASQTSQQSIILRDLSPKYVNYEPIKNQKQKQTKKMFLQEKENQNTII